MFCHWFSFLSLDRPVRTGFVFRQDYLDMLYLLSLLNDFYIHFSFFLYNYSFCILYFYTICFLPCLFDSVLNTFLSMFRSCCFWCMSFLYVYYNRSFVLCNCFLIIHTYVIIAFSLRYFLFVESNCLLITTMLIIWTILAFIYIYI